MSAAETREQVCTADGQAYERAAIEEWLQDHDESPATGARLTSKILARSPPLAPHPSTPHPPTPRRPAARVACRPSASMSRHPHYSLLPRCSEQAMTGSLSESTA